MRNHCHTTSGALVCGSVVGFSAVVGFKSGAEGIRTPDPLIANEVRYQLRYSPLVGPRLAGAKESGNYSPTTRASRRVSVASSAAT